MSSNYTREGIVIAESNLQETSSPTTIENRSRSSRSRSAATSLPKLQLCPTFSEGVTGGSGCLAGDRCSFAHGAQELLFSARTWPEAFPARHIIRLLRDLLRAPFGRPPTGLWRGLVAE
ncbi:unnamed protein product, partial [Polarella glacialis]